MPVIKLSYRISLGKTHSVRVVTRKNLVFHSSTSRPSVTIRSRLPVLQTRSPVEAFASSQATRREVKSRRREYFHDHVILR